ncbi:M50 family metallopeptidase [Myxococcus sp. RHSTA-1-4]|uniref:M50 family metallopeptidase n=1 Tax=Myxococcus sp. RHSTA-1-4 TaxID=2874601 RepID=UPI001CBB48E6|nr:M50 family metallopeptidase [Myxococcus sp. RHSTA-1-4]MBZ4417815.1 M50 family metallopeptidase [Myxococcus sp. RHSTA-1-4]
MRPHFHVAGFPVRVHPLFFLISLATGWALRDEPARLALWVGIVFVSVLLHELGHALAFRRFGRTAAIELHGMGGTTTSGAEEELTHRHSAWVSFAGPGMGFLLGGLVWALSSLTPLGQQGGLAGFAARQLLWVNVGWGLFNLLPMQPLDGGHLLASMVRARSGYRYERVLHGIGIATALGVLGLSIWWGQVWMGLLAMLFGVMNLEQLLRLPREFRFQRAAAPPRRRRAPRRGPEAGSVSVERLLGELRSAPRAGPPDGTAAGTHRAPASLKVPDADAPEGPPDPVLVGEMFLEGGLAALAVRPLQQAFAASPSARTGHALVLALLEAGRFRELESLLAGPHAARLSGDTLLLLSERAGRSGHDALASRAAALRDDRPRQ